MNLSKKLSKPMLPDETRREIQARESYHVLKIISEFVEAGEELYAIQSAISIYGNARTPENHPDYELTLRLTRELLDTGFSVTSDGGLGIVEAANKGVFIDASPTVELSIVLSHEQRANPHQDLSIKFQHSFPRKVMSVKHVVAYVVMPDGFDTLDGLFGSLMLVQMGKTPNRPIILAGRDFWSGLLDWIRKELLGRGLIAAAGMDLIRLTDDEDEVIEEISAHYENWLEMLGELGANTWSPDLQVVYCHCRFISEGAGHLKRVLDGLWFRCVRSIGETAVKR